MKMKKSLPELINVAEKCRPEKILNLSVAVTEPDLSKTVREAFELAKSSGRELDLDFNLPLDIGPARFALPQVDG
jgi:hypothetical protein